MIQKSLLHIVAILVITIALTACGDKGLDGKLNFSLTDYKTVFGKGYDEALAKALPEQQNVLNERMLPVVATVVSLAENSNPATVEAFQAKKNAEEFDRVSRMSVREIVVYYLEKEQSSLNNIVSELEKFQRGETLKVEDGISIDRLSIDGEKNPNGITENTERLDVFGTLPLRNDSNIFDYSIMDYKLALIIDGKQVEELKESSGTKGDGIRSSELIKSKGGKLASKFSYSIIGKENVKMFYDLYKSGQAGKLDFSFKPSKDIMIHLNSDTNSASWLDAGGAYLDGYKTQLKKATNDLAVMKK